MGLALDVWNEVSFEPAEKFSYRAAGEGAEKLNKGTRNLLTKAYAHLFETCGQKVQAAAIRANNGIWMSSGLGSSAAAIIAGLMGANEILAKPLSQDEILKLASEMEGHPDNVAPGLLGGLVISAQAGAEILLRRYELPAWTIVLVKPQVEWLTKTARAVLPKSISRADAVFNMGRAVLVADALRSGDLALLQKAMEDRLHQPYRLRHISGGAAAYKVAKTFGAAALSGAGPSIIAFIPAQRAEAARQAIVEKFTERGIETQSVITRPSMLGAQTLNP